MRVCRCLDGCGCTETPFANMHCWANIALPMVKLAKATHMSVNTIRFAATADSEKIRGNLQAEHCVLNVIVRPQSHYLNDMHIKFCHRLLLSECFFRSYMSKIREMV